MISLITALAFAAQNTGIPAPLSAVPALKTAPTPEVLVPEVPFYSQFKDIRSPKWQKVGCGIASLAMIIDFYSSDPISVNALLKKGVASGAYDQNAGWKYDGLIKLSQEFGLNGTYYDWSNLDKKTALGKLKPLLKDGPVMLSVHYKFDPNSTIPHLVVVSGIDGDTIHYNDPAEKSGDKEISTAKLLTAWKKKVVIIRPSQKTPSPIPLRTDTPLARSPVDPTMAHTSLSLIDGSKVQVHSYQPTRRYALQAIACTCPTRRPRSSAAR